jgi:hypothetical protein
MVVVGVFVIAAAVRVPMFVLSNPKANEKHPCDQTDRATDLDTTKHGEWIVNLCETEVGFRIEEHADHGEATDEMPDADKQTRRQAGEPLVRLIQRIGGGDRPSVTGFDTVDSTECDRTE